MKQTSVAAILALLAFLPAAAIEIVPIEPVLNDFAGTVADELSEAPVAGAKVVLTRKVSNILQDPVYTVIDSMTTSDKGKYGFSLTQTVVHSSPQTLSKAGIEVIDPGPIMISNDTTYSLTVTHSDYLSDSATGLRDSTATVVTDFPLTRKTLPTFAGHVTDSVTKDPIEGHRLFSTDMPTIRTVRGFSLR